MRNDILVSVTAPAFNEEETIKEFIDQTVKVLKDNYANYELVIVDDGSSDKTIEFIQQIQKSEANIRIIKLSRNYGREVALTAGIENSIGDVVVVMDADLQDPPSLIPEMINKLMTENYDIVYAARLNRLDESFLKKITSKMFYRIATKMTGLSIPENAGDFRVMNRKVINSLVKMKEKIRYMKMLYAFVGYKIGSVPFERQARFKGVTKYNYFKLINAAMDAIISFSDMPLRMVTWLSVLISILTFVISFKGIIDKFIIRDIEPGWSSLFFLVAMMFSILFLCLAVISEYISRILTESKDRPLYHVSEEINSSTSRVDLNIVDDL